MACNCDAPSETDDAALTLGDLAACPRCVTGLPAEALREVIVSRDSLIDRLHETRAMLMGERDDANARAVEYQRQRDEARQAKMWRGRTSVFVWLAMVRVLKSPTKAGA